jgi:hypothetical protein
MRCPSHASSAAALRSNVRFPSPPFSERPTAPLANVIWVPLGLNFCAPRAVSPYYIPAWGVPLVYELLLLLALVWNAIDRPRQARVSLVRALQRDGIVFMLVRVAMVHPARPRPDAFPGHDESSCDPAQHGRHPGPVQLLRSLIARHDLSDAPHTC